MNTMNIVEGTNISFSYEWDGTLALESVSLQMRKGELSVILGGNGSGKSTLVRHFNGLLPLQKGRLTVAGRDLSEKDGLWQLRRECGMVFQNPDNQFVSSVVEEDLAFGLRNYNVPPAEIPMRIRQALGIVGMEGFEQRSTHMLSGGQKQRIALAGVLALEPELLLFDEATSMLDPEGRAEILALVQSLHSQGRQSIVMITHYIEEAAAADRIFLMQAGKLAASGVPRDILTDAELLKSCGLQPPLPVKMYYDLKAEGILLSHCPLTNEELINELCPLL